MAVTVHYGDRIVFVGDSITAEGWWGSSTVGGTGLAVDQINAQIPIIAAPRFATSTGGATVVSGASPATVLSVSTQAAIDPVNSGVAGNKIANLAAAVASRVTDYNPQIIVVQVGINDVVAATGTGSFRTSYDSFLDQIRTWSSSVPIICLSVTLWGEQWASGPLRWNNGPSSHDIDLPPYNTEVQASCTSHGGTYIDVYQAFLVAESIQNTPEPGIAEGVLTRDHIHPTAAGQLVMSNALMTQIVVAP